MNPSPAMSQKCHGVQAKRLNLHKTIQKPTQTSQTLLERLENKKVLRENQTYKIKPKNKNIRNNKQTKFLKVSDSPLDMGFFLFFCFP